MRNRKSIVPDYTAYMASLTAYALEQSARGEAAIPLYPKNKDMIAWNQLAAEAGVPHNLLIAQSALRDHVFRLAEKYGEADPTVTRQRQAALKILDTYRDDIPPRFRGFLHLSEIGNRCAVTEPDLRSPVCRQALALCALLHDLENPVEPAQEEEVADFEAFWEDPQIKKTGVPWHPRWECPDYTRIAKMTGLRPAQLRSEPFAARLQALIAEIGFEPHETTAEEIARTGQFVSDAIRSGRPVPRFKGNVNLTRIATELGIKRHRFTYVPALAAALERWAAAFSTPQQEAAE